MASPPDLLATDPIERRSDRLLSIESFANRRQQPHRPSDARREDRSSLPAASSPPLPHAVEIAAAEEDPPEIVAAVEVWTVRRIFCVVFAGAALLVGSTFAVAALKLGVGWTPATLNYHPGAMRSPSAFPTGEPREWQDFGFSDAPTSS
mmetsp:Transcript_6268/g.13581  ORF Transcript_6268/g.13581 Transcript_6268/m.13581 type:complete len:149 (-) Transcript_6268:505-951(-)